MCLQCVPTSPFFFSNSFVFLRRLFSAGPHLFPDCWPFFRFISPLLLGRHSVLGDPRLSLGGPSCRFWLPLLQLLSKWSGFPQLQPCRTSAARPFSAVIRYVDFSWSEQRLCSATVSNWRRNTAQDVFPLNVGGYTVIVPTPCARPSSALASTASYLAWNLRLVASICERVSLKVLCVLALVTSDLTAALSLRNSLVCTSRATSTVCNSTCVLSIVFVSSLRRFCVLWLVFSNSDP
jgi:hypothetical protein